MNLGIGIGLAIIIVTGILILVFAIKGTKSISPFCYLFALILAVLLSLQFSLMFGAITTKKEIDNISDNINGCLQFLTSGDDASYTMDEIASLVENFQNSLPELLADIGQLTLCKVDKKDLGTSLMAQAKIYLNEYILFRILWSLLFVVVATISMIMLPNYGGVSNYRKSYIREERVSSRRNSDRRSPSRRIRKY